MRTTSPARRLAIAAGLLIAVLVACGRDITGPASAPVSLFKQVAAFAFAPQYETAVPASMLRSALQQVAFERVRITLRREDGSIALDTVVLFPVGSDSLILSLNVPLPANAPASGVALNLTLGYVNAAGDTVFKGGPVPVTVVPGTGGAPPAPVQVPVQYTGPGATASSVVISPKIVSGLAGQSVGFSAEARSATGQVIAGTPIVYASSNEGVVTVNSTTGAADLVGRGSAKVYAMLLTGPRDSATVTVALPAARLALGNGDGQTAPAGTTLPQAVTARVLATDGVGVSGVTVAFAPSGGGTATPATAVSDASGTVSTQWKLGATSGAQTLTITSAGLTGSPLTVTATAQAVTPARLAVQTGPLAGKAGVALNAMKVMAQDAAGNNVATFTGDVTVTIGANPGSATLSGTTTVSAVGGVATFSDLKLNRPGSGYTFVFSSAGLTAATSAAFDIAAGDAASLVFGAMPATVDAGVPVAPAIIVTAQDASGNAVTSFTGAVTVALGVAPSGATLGGTLTRNAVAGVATFDNLTINRSGVGYTLTAAAAGLGSATSAPFSVAAGAPSVIAVTSGGGQTAVVGSVLKPIVVQLRDALGNGIAGATLSLMLDTPVAAVEAAEAAAPSPSSPMSLVPGYGSLSASSVVTDASGSATFTWTLGLMTGTQRVRVSLASPAVTTYVTATAMAGAAATLVVSTPPSSLQTAGAPLSPSVVVQARDALGVLQTSFVGSVTAAIATGPAGATLGGTTVVTAVSGAATFSALRLTKAGAYTLQFSASGLSSATTASFTVGAAPARTIAADSGNAQSAAAGSVLPQQLVVMVTDSLGNPVSGAPLSWTVTAGGGTLSSQSSTTDALGRGRSSLQLGAAAGSNTVQVSSAGLVGSPVTLTATGIVGAAAQLAITRQPRASSTAGTADTVVAVVNDAGGNVITNSTATVTLALASGPTGGAILGPTSVAAVNGVATFNGIAFNKTGAYTLTFASAGLTSATSTGSSITAGAAKGIAADSGSGQSGAAGVTLPQPLVVLVTDSLGNAVSGTTVSWTVTGGGGSLSGVTSPTDASGRARASLTLGTTPGANTVQAASSGLTGSPVTFTATTTIGAATQLVISRQPRASSASGAADTIIVEVKDANGNVVTGSTATVSLSIATGPAGATFMGPATVAAANGVATFIGTAFDKMGSYTLTLASTGLTSATSTSFTITPGWPKFVAADSGNTQTGPAGQPLKNQIVARITDQYGNPVTGRTVAWAVASGGGALSNTSTVSDSGGRVRAQWSLGLTVGSQSATASAADTGLTVNVASFTATANAVAFNKAWTGATSTDWNAASNWSPAGVPAATDSVRIDPGANSPVLTANTSIARLQMDPSSALSLGTYQLTVNGSIDVPATGFGGVTGSKVILGGATGSTIVGVYGTDVQFSGGSYTMTGGVTVNGSVSITTGSLDLTMHGLTVSGDFTTSGSGVVNQSTAALNVTGNVSFGGSGTSTFTGGDFAVAGNFTALSTAKVSMVPPHNIKINGVGPQTISLVTGSVVTFANVELSGTGSKALPAGSQMAIDGTAFVLAGSGPLSGSGRTVLRGPGIIDATAGSWNVDTVFVGVGTVTKLPATLPAKHLQISSGGVQLTSPLTLPNANVFVYGGTLDVNGQSLSIGKDFTTTGNGLLRMAVASGTLTIAGNASFRGADASGQLTAGTLVIGGNFAQDTNPQAFKAGPGHVTQLTGTANQTITLAHPDLQYAPGCVNACFGQLRSDKTAGVVTLASDVKTDSSMMLSGMDTLKAAGRTLHARGDFSANGRVDGAVFARYVRYAGSITRTGGLFSVDTLVAFGASPMIAGYESRPLIVRGSGTLPARIYSTVIVDSTTGVVQTAGKDTLSALITRNGGRLKMVNAGDSLFVQGDATFQGGATTGLLTAGTLVVGGNLKIVGAALDASGTHTVLMRSDTGRTLDADLQSGTVGFQNLVFAGMGAKAVTYPSSWAINVKGKMIARSGAGPVGSDAANSQLWMRAGSAVYDSTATSDAFRFTRLYLSDVIALPSKLVVGDLWIQGNVLQLADSLYTTASVTVSSGLLDLNGRRLRMVGTGKSFTTQYGAVLKMKNAADELVVENGNSVTFSGGATDTTLTAGVITVSGDFAQSGDAKAFAARAGHTVQFTGAGVHRVQFANPGYAASHFGRLLHHTADTLNLRSDAVARTIETQGTAGHLIRRDMATYPRLFTKGASVHGFVLEGVSWQIDTGEVVTAIDTASFTLQDPTASQFLVRRTGPAFGATGSMPSLTGAWTFSSAPTTGVYLDAQDVDGVIADSLAVNFPATVNPLAHGGKVLLSGGAKTNWPFGLALTAVAAGGDWNTASTWSPAVVPSANDDVTISSPSYVSLSGTGNARHVTIGSGGSVMLNSATLRVSGNLNASGAYLSGYGGTVAIAGAGTHALDIGSIPALAVEAGAVAVAASNLSISGNATIDGRLVPNGKYVYVSGLLDVRSGGALKMTNALDSVVVGDASFAGVASGDSLLTDGRLVVNNSFTQGGTATSFAPTGNHVTWLSGSGFVGPALRAARTRSLAETAVPVNRRGAMVASNTVSFANPGWALSRFNILRINHTNDAALNFGSHVYAVRAEAVGPMSYTYRTIRAASPQTFFVKGADLVYLTFDGVALQVDLGGTLTRLDTLTFSNQDSTAVQLTLNLDASRTLSQFSFETPPSSGKYLAVNGSGGPVVTMASPRPASHGGFVATSGGASIANWVANRTMISRNSGAWSDTLTWNPYGLPSRYDDVSVGAGHAVTLYGGAAEARHVTLTPTSGLAFGYGDLDVYGNWVSDTLSTISSQGGRIRFLKTADVSGRIGAATTFAPVRAAGTTVATGLVVMSGAFDVNGKSVFVHGPFSTDSAGYLRMASVGGVMQVDGNATFSGASSYPNLTEGMLHLRGSFFQGGDPAAFAAIGNHTTVWGSPGMSGRTLRFSNAGNTTTSSHFGILQLADTTQLTAVGSDVWALTRLVSTSTGTSITLFRDGGVYTDTAVAPRLHVTDVISTGYLYFNRVMLDVRDATPGTVLNNAVFNMFSNSTGETQLTIATTSASPLSLNFTGIGFQSTPTSTYRYLDLVNMGTATVTANFLGMYPSWAIASPKVSTAGSPLPTIVWSP